MSGSSVSGDGWRKNVACTVFDLHLTRKNVKYSQKNIISVFSYQKIAPVKEYVVLCSKEF